MWRDRGGRRHFQARHDAIRKPRLKRVDQGQVQGVVRDDVPATEVCRRYDALRIDAVRRWLYLKDENAIGQQLHDRIVTELVRGIEPRASISRGHTIIF